MGSISLHSWTRQTSYQITCAFCKLGTFSAGAKCFLIILSSGQFLCRGRYQRRPRKWQASPESNHHKQNMVDTYNLRERMSQVSDWERLELLKMMAHWEFSAMRLSIYVGIQWTVVSLVSHEKGVFWSIPLNGVPFHPNRSLEWLQLKSHPNDSHSPWTVSFNLKPVR